MLKTNAEILAQLTLLGTGENRFEDFLAQPERGAKLLVALQTFDPGCTGFQSADLYAAAQGLCRLCEALLAHLIERYKGQARIKNLTASGKLLSLMRSGAAIDRKTLNRMLGTFYVDWPYAAHWRRDLYRIPAGGLTVMGLVYSGLQKLRDMRDEQAGMI